MLSNGLTNLDSRGLAALLKELAKGHHGRRAREVGGGGGGRGADSCSRVAPSCVRSDLDLGYQATRRSIPR
jgi:hypothetical protein